MQIATAMLPRHEAPECEIGLPGFYMSVFLLLNGACIALFDYAAGSAQQSTCGPVAIRLWDDTH